MSDTIISQKSAPDQLYSPDERDRRYWIPVCLVGNPSGLIVEVKMRINPAQFGVALAWAERTAEDPTIPRRPNEIFPETREAGMRMLCRRLSDKGILMWEGRGYVMYEAARQHLNYHREREA